MKKASIVYVLCPSYTKTGGTELMHQLVYQLNELKMNAKIAYYSLKEDKPLCHPAFEKYVKNNIVIEAEIEDSEDISIVFPEIYCDHLINYSKAYKYVWWMSVDNFFLTNDFIGRMKLRGLPSAIKQYLLGNLKDKTQYIYMADKHLCQSYYAMDFLKSKNIEDDKIEYLSDYVNDVYLEDYEEPTSASREKIVLYNPRKGFKFTKRIIKEGKDIHWIALENMTTEQVHQLMKKSKVYIDFGNHPGKDRFPREAAISGCCVITGKRGAARFYEDVMIPNSYKFDEKKSEINDILETIRMFLSNYDVASKEFAGYREHILSEKAIFVQDVIKIFVDIKE